MKKTSFFNSLKDTFSFIGEDLYFLLQDFLGAIVNGSTFFYVIVEAIALPTIILTYWVGFPLFKFLPLNLGRWLLPLIWVVLALIGILVMALVDYYIDTHPDNSPHEHYADLSGWPD